MIRNVATTFSLASKFVTRAKKVVIARHKHDMLLSFDRKKSTCTRDSTPHGKDRCHCRTNLPMSMIYFDEHLLHENQSYASFVKTMIRQRMSKHQYVLARRTNERDNRWWFYYDKKSHSSTMNTIESTGKLLAHLLGTPIAQNLNGDKMVCVKRFSSSDATKYLETNKNGSAPPVLRYHQTTTGGDFHTDGVATIDDFDIVQMSTIRAARDLRDSIMKQYHDTKTLPGTSVLIPLDSILTRLHQSTQHALFYNVPWDARGFEPPILNRPILYYRRKSCERQSTLCIRYLRSYIDAGVRHYIKTDSTETEYTQGRLQEIIDLLDEVDIAIKDSPKIEIACQDGDHLFVSAHQMLHGRTSFVDPERLLHRYWIKTS